MHYNTSSMKLTNLIETILKSEPNTTLTTAEITTILGLENWQPTTKIEKLEEPQITSKEITADSITSKEIEYAAENEAYTQARRIIIKNFIQNVSNDKLHDFKYYNFLNRPNEEKAPDHIIDNAVKSKAFTFRPKTKLRVLWSEMYETYHKAYNDALANVDKDAIKNKLIQSKTEARNSEINHAKRRYNDQKANLDQTETILKKYEDNEYINNTCLEGEIIIPGMIESEKYENLYYSTENKWLKFKPITITTIDEAIKNPEKFKDNYIFTSVIIGPHEENSKIEGGMKSSATFNASENLQARSHSESFLLWSDNESSINKQTNYNMQHNASAWIATKKEGIDFIVTNRDNKIMTICSFPLNGTIKAYSLQPDKEDNILRSKVSETHLELTLQNLKNSQREVIIGGIVDKGGIFLADTILSAYSGMSHNIGYLEKR